MRHVRQVVRSLGHFLGNHSANLLGLEQRSRREIEVRELRLRAAQTRHAGPGLRGLPIPQDAVARRVSHGTTAAELVKQATSPSTLTEGHRRLLVLEELHTRATGL